jgi:tellurite resistance protein
LVGRVILLISAVSWLAVVVTYLSHHLTSARPRWTGISDDLLDPIAAPFASLAFIVPILLASDGLFPQAPTPGRVITDVFIALTVLLGGWFTGQWIYGPVALDRFHPGYFLPTVASGLIASYGAAVVGQLRLAEVLLGFGVISRIVLGSLILGRLFFRPLLPPPLQPTMAIEVAPAAVASLAWFAIHGARIDMVAVFLAGYGVLMVIAQPLTATSPSLYRAMSCAVAFCGAKALLIFDVQSNNKGYTGQVTLKGYDTMTGLGTPNGQYFVNALRRTEK